MKEVGGMGGGGTKRSHCVCSSSDNKRSSDFKPTQGGAGLSNFCRDGRGEKEGGKERRGKENGVGKSEGVTYSSALMGMSGIHVCIL